MTTAYQRILVPLDGSELAAGALSHAQTLATLANARVVLLQVIPSTAMLASETSIGSAGLGLGAASPMLTASQFASMEETITQDAQSTLDAAAAPLRAASLQVDTVILRGLPADSILHYASTEAIDLIVMSTHGRTGLARVVFGSVAESVLRHAPCPVLLVRVISE